MSPLVSTACDFAAGCLRAEAAFEVAAHFLVAREVVDAKSVKALALRFPPCAAAGFPSWLANCDRLRAPRGTGHVHR